MVDETKAVATTDAQPPMSNGDRLVAMAIESGADIDKLERLIELRNAEEAREARLAFDTHFGEMQAEFTAVGKNKDALDYNGEVMYAYAPLETLQLHYNPIIFKHGFSYRWREDAIETGKRCVLCISGHGHITETSFDIPKIPSNKRMNDVQAAGSMSSYGRRYTFIAGFGVIIADEDDDAASVPNNNGQTVAEVQTQRKLPNMDKARAEIYKLIERYEPLVAREIIDNAKLDMEAAKSINDMRDVYRELKKQCEDATREEEKAKTMESAKTAGASILGMKKASELEPTDAEIDAAIIEETTEEQQEELPIF